jgi:hypothetical protein
MRKTEFFALQCSIWIVGSAAATNPVTKYVFLALGIIYLLLQITTAKNND